MYPLCKKHFDITKKTDVDKTFRVAEVEDDFDLKPENADEHFTGTFDLTHPWQIGLIVGGQVLVKLPLPRMSSVSISLMG